MRSNFLCGKIFFLALLFIILDYRDHTCYFHALTFAGSLGRSLNIRPSIAGARRSCLNMRTLGRMFKLLSRDPANVNVLKQTCLVVILAFYMIP